MINQRIDLAFHGFSLKLFRSQLFRRHRSLSRSRLCAVSWARSCFRVSSSCWTLCSEALHLAEAGSGWLVGVVEPPYKTAWWQGTPVFRKHVEWIRWMENFESLGVVGWSQNLFVSSIDSWDCWWLILPLFILNIDNRLGTIHSWILADRNHIGCVIFNY